MAYLLDMLVPGLGHLLIRRWLDGGVLIGAWITGLVGAFVASSFDVRAVYLLLGVHPLVVSIAVFHLLWCGRRRSHRETRWWWSVALLPVTFALISVAALLFTNAVIRPVKVRSGSMAPSVVTGDIVLVQMFGPHLRALRLGDIVLFAHPGQPGRLLIKRILGVAGDLIQIRGGELMRNGHRLAQCELRSLRDHETRQSVIERLEVLEGRPYLVWDRPAIRSRALDVRVPAHHLFVVGDNRDRSGDSRAFGTIPVGSVRGLVTVRIAPVLTNEVYQAPLGARRAASQRCSARSRAQESGEGS